MTKKYTLTTSEETVTENPEDIIRLMKLAGLTNAQPVAEEEVTEEVEAEVYEPTEANDKLDLDDYSKKSPESIAKQKKSIQPTLGDNPLEYSLDENEIQEALMKEFDASEKLAEERTDETPAHAAVGAAALLGRGALAVGKAVGKALWRNPVKSTIGAAVISGDDEPVNASKKKKGAKLNASCGAQHEVKEEKEEVTEELTAGQKKLPPALQKSILAKQGKKDDTVEETEETEKTVEENLELAEKQIKTLKEDCSCGHGSDCDCGPECGCGCNAVNEDQERLSKLAGIKRETQINEDESVFDEFVKMYKELDHEGTDEIVFGLSNHPKYRFSMANELNLDKETNRFNSYHGMTDHSGYVDIKISDLKAHMNGVAVHNNTNPIKMAGDWKTDDDVLPPEPRDTDIYPHADDYEGSDGEIASGPDDDQVRLGHLAGLKNF